MKPQPSFSDIEKYSTIVEDNEFFTQYTNQTLAEQYDANFVLLKFPPVLAEFKVIEKMHLEYQLSIGQTHLHFYWPENAGLYMEILDYFSVENYEVGMQTLQVMKPQNFNPSVLNENVHLEFVTKSTLEQFLEINYNEDIKLGDEHAAQQESVYRYQFHLPQVKFLLATIDKHPVGSLILISTDNYLEIDGLLTATSFRGQKIATTMIAFVMEEALKNKKEVILVADAKDTPQEMYRKMGFDTISSQIHAQKRLAVKNK